MVKEGETKLFFWKVEETDGNADSMLFDDAAMGGSDEGFKVQWVQRQESDTLCMGGQASNDTPTFDQAYFNVNGFCT